MRNSIIWRHISIRRRLPLALSGAKVAQSYTTSYSGILTGDDIILSFDAADNQNSHYSFSGFIHKITLHLILPDNHFPFWRVVDARSWLHPSD